MSAGGGFVAEGEVVEIVERGRQRVARVLLTSRVMVELDTDSPDDLQLGDRVICDGIATLSRTATGRLAASSGFDD